MKKTKIFLYILLGLIVIGLVPIVFLNTWAMCRLWQVGREKTRGTQPLGRDSPKRQNGSGWEESPGATAVAPLCMNISLG